MNPHPHSSLDRVREFYIRCDDPRRGCPSCLAAITKSRAAPALLAPTLPAPTRWRSNSRRNHYLCLCRCTSTSRPPRADAGPRAGSCPPLCCSPSWACCTSRARRACQRSGAGVVPAPAMAAATATRRRALRSLPRSSRRQRSTGRTSARRGRRSCCPRRCSTTRRATTTTARSARTRAGSRSTPTSTGGGARSRLQSARPRSR